MNLMTSLILPQLTDYSLENRDQHVMFCYFVQKHTPTPPAWGQFQELWPISPIFSFVPQLRYPQGTVPTLHPAPTLSSANYLLLDSFALPEDEGADQDG